MSLLGLCDAVGMSNALGSVLILSDNALFLIHETDLYGIIAVILNGLDLRHGAGTSLENGHRYKRAVFLEYFCHSDFDCKDCFLHIR